MNDIEGRIYTLVGEASTLFMGEGGVFDDQRANRIAQDLLALIGADQTHRSCHDQLKEVEDERDDARGATTAWRERSERYEKQIQKTILQRDDALRSNRYLASEIDRLREGEAAGGLRVDQEVSGLRPADNGREAMTAEQRAFYQMGIRTLRDELRSMHFQVSGPASVSQVAERLENK